MTIAIGQQLASYEITALLGKRGMGDVYRDHPNVAAITLVVFRTIGRPL
jgi:hypothetical protein